MGETPASDWQFIYVSSSQGVDPICAVTFLVANVGPRRGVESWPLTYRVSVITTRLPTH